MTMRVKLEGAEKADDDLIDIMTTVSHASLQYSALCFVHVALPCMLSPDGAAAEL